MQAVIEQSHDKDGIIWPASVAPYQVCIAPLNVVTDGPIMPLAENLYSELRAQGVDVLLGGRDERLGVEVKDADLVGFPVRIALGEKSLASGVVEIKPRGGELTKVAPEDAVARVLELLRPSGSA